MESLSRAANSTKTADGRRNHKSFISFMQRAIERKTFLGKTGTARNYRATLRSFEKFSNGREVPLKGITQGVIEEYEAWLGRTTISSNSVSFYMRNMRAMYNRAVEARLTVDRAPFKKAYTRIEKTSKRAITLADIKRIKEVDLSAHPALDLARDTFMFLFYCRGMSFIDAAHLTRDHISGNELRYRRHKTGQQIRIGLNDYITGLIAKWHTLVPDNCYLLPIIHFPYARDYNRCKPERTLYESALRRTNKALKKIARIAAIPTTLTTYVTRHSWASIAKSKGIPTATISDALGHDSELTTQIYLASLSSDAIDRANSFILSDL
ncbi:MAG: site-specific integrase [Barnesiella sp.]|nr:site-specific integrase [Barnesiella sp.]